MEFCEKCNSILLRKNNFKCLKCEQISDVNIPKTTEIQSKDNSFSFMKNQYYIQKEIRAKFGTGIMDGINWDKTHTCLILFRNARKPNPSQNNVYHDRYDRESGLYYYTGKGRTGDQTLSGVNLDLKNSKNNKIKVHLFWQHNFNSNHQYIGEVEVIDTKQDIQPDSEEKNRLVYVFTLKPGQV